MQIMRPDTAPAGYLVHAAMTRAILGTACTPPRWIITPDRGLLLLFFQQIGIKTVFLFFCISTILFVSPTAQMPDFLL